MQRTLKKYIHVIKTLTIVISKSLPPLNCGLRSPGLYTWNIGEGKDHATVEGKYIVYPGQEIVVYEWGWGMWNVFLFLRYGMWNVLLFMGLGKWNVLLFMGLGKWNVLLFMGLGMWNSLLFMGWGMWNVLLFVGWGMCNFFFQPVGNM